MITKNEIRNLFKWFGDKHANINYNNYAVNHLWEVDKDLESDGVVMWVNSLQSPLTGRINKRTYQVFMMDLVNIDEDNAHEIESDTEQILLDLLSFVDQYPQEVGKMFTLDRTTVTIEPFRERFDSEYAGNILRFSLNVPFNYNTCQIPYND